jgi:hypothetical protein
MSTKISLLLTFSLLVAGCSLDEHPRDQIPEQEAYATPHDLFMNTVATLYNYIGGNTDGQGLQGTCRGVYDLQTFGSDEAMLPTRGGDWFDGGIWEDMYMHAWDAGHELPKNAWLYLYKVINLCNNSIEELEKHQNMLTKIQYTEYNAEVRALRAIYYWYLLDLFARVPIITTSQASMRYVQLSNRTQVFRFVIDELLKVCDHLMPDNSVKPGDYYGRVTRPVALFVLAKLMLNAEVYLDDDWTDKERPDGSKIRFQIDNQTMNAWEATIYYCEEIKRYGFLLEKSLITNFMVRNEQSNENIWVIPMDKDLYRTQNCNMLRSLHYRHAAAYGFTGENGTSATKRVLEIFDYNTNQEDNRFKFFYWAGVVEDLDGNPILDRTGKPLVYYPDKVAKDLGNSPFVETAGARMQKYTIDKNGTKDGKLTDNDIVLFRLADVYLMEAEAKFRNGEGGQDEYNAIRDRVNMPRRPISLQNLLDERLLELCWEGWRRQDLIRFGQFKSLYEGEDIEPVVDESDGHTTVFPIPGDILIQNENLTQNPGY